MLTDIKDSIKAFINAEEEKEVYYRFFFYAEMAMTVVFIITAIVFYIWDLHLVDIIGECWIYNKTGLYCTGCGGTRSLTYLFHFDLIKSLYYHPAVLYIAYLYLCIFFSNVFSFLGIAKFKAYRIKNSQLYLLVAIIILQCIIKNWLHYLGYYNI